MTQHKEKIANLRIRSLSTTYNIDALLIFCASASEPVKGFTNRQNYTLMEITNLALF